MVALAALSAAAGTAAHRSLPVRGLLAHLLVCVAMAGMAVPALAGLGPLPWVLGLGTVAVAVAGTRRDAPLVLDLVTMAVVVVVMPRHGSSPGAAVPAGGGHAHGAGSAGWLPAVELVVVCWVLARVALWWTRRRGPAEGPGTPRPRARCRRVADGAMAAAMLAMAG